MVFFGFLNQKEKNNNNHHEIHALLLKVVLNINNISLFEKIMVICFLTY
jgi:hypothetical protein